MTERDVDRLLQDPSIIRNRAKIQATVENARAMSAAAPSLAALARSYERTRKRAPRALADLPTSTPQAETFAKQLKSQGYRFVGPTSVYAFMQNVGVVNDHRARLLPSHRTTPNGRSTRKDRQWIFWTTEQAWRRGDRDVLEPAVQLCDEGGLRRA